MVDECAGGVFSNDEATRRLVALNVKPGRHQRLLEQSELDLAIEIQGNGDRAERRRGILRIGSALHCRGGESNDVAHEGAFLGSAKARLSIRDTACCSRLEGRPRG